MTLFSIYYHFIFLHFLSLSQDTQGIPIANGIYNYRGVSIPPECRHSIQYNSLLHPEALPKFKDISPTDIRIAYICARKFYQTNSKKFYFSSQNEKRIFTNVIKAPFEFVKFIKDTMLKNNFTEDLREMDESLTSTDDDYQRLHLDHSELSKEYQEKLNHAKKSISLLVKEDEFPDVNDFNQIYLEAWSKEAKIQGSTSSTPKHGPWYIFYNNLELVFQATQNNELREKICSELLRAGIYTSDIVDDLRQIYTDEATKTLTYSDVIDKKIEHCLAKSYESANAFLYEVEKNLTTKQNNEPISVIEYGIALNVLAKRAYFPHKHVLKELFDLIGDFFQIDITEIDKSKYQVYADGMKLYEVKNELNEKVGFFYIDFFARNDHKVFPMPYTQILRYGIKELNIIPIVFISLHTKAENRFDLGEVRALFHEMGHCLQQIFADNDKIWMNYDTVEFPAILMELFAYQGRYVSQLSAEQEPQRLSEEEYYQVHKAYQKIERQSLIAMLQQSIIELNLYSHPHKDSKEIIEEVRKEFKFKKTCDRTFRDSMLPEYLYVGTSYTYPLSFVLATDALNYLYKDHSKFYEKALQFRRLVFEMKDVDKLGKAFQKFVGRDKIDIEPFYKFWGIANKVGLKSI